MIKNIVGPLSHSLNQKKKTEVNMFFFLVLMIDPAVAYAPGQGYAAYDRGKALDIWLKAANGSDSLGLVWPGKHWKVIDNPNFLLC